jgi:STE24 endopeptidase
MNIIVILVVILLLEFGLDRILAYLNNKNSSVALPSELSDIYDPEKYSKQQQYFQTNFRFGMFTAIFNLIVIMVLLIMGGFGILDSWISTQLSDAVWQSLLFFGILYIGNDILQTPFEWDHTFNIEAKYGFNKTTHATFIADKFKSWGVTAILGGAILYAIISIYYISPEYFWLLAFAVVTVFSLFMGMFYSELIVPLFNKQTPLQEGELRDAIEKMADKAGFKLKNIFVIDGSKRSTKANAYFTGLGHKKRIVLYDTLMDKLTTEEIVAVLAHEIGHFKKKHIIKSYAFTLPFNLLMFYLLGLMLNSDSLAIALGGTEAVFHLNAIAFFILYTPLSTVFDLAGNIISRKNEFEADAFAAKYGMKDALITGLKKLSSTSLSNLMPHPLYVFFNYSHPTLFQRMKKLEAEII